MKQLPKLSPHSRKVHRQVIEMIESMTPEEALAFLTYRDPDVPMTDMFGIFGLYDEDQITSTKQENTDENLRDAA
jgi:hypothetical protein